MGAGIDNAFVSDTYTTLRLLAWHEKNGTTN